MYCVKCGVKLADDIDRCPLCSTMVWDPDGTRGRSTLYPDQLPATRKRHRHALTFSVTLLFSIACVIIFLICEKIYGNAAWCGVADLGLVLYYIAFILPTWFERPNPVIFIPVTHIAILGYLLYLCVHYRGNWFLSFAAPVVFISMILLTAFAALLRYVSGGRYYIFGGLFILSGGASLLIEYLQHITFGTPIFVWSLYVLGACTVLGIVLILAGIIRPMRDYFNRMFFI